MTSRSLFVGLAMLSVTAFAAPPPPLPLTPPLPSTPSSANEKNVTLEFRGSLREALRQIASQSGINLVATGDLDRPSEVYLKNASGTDALETVALAYHLKISRKGSIWTLRPMTTDEIDELEENHEPEEVEEVAGVDEVEDEDVAPGNAALTDAMRKLKNVREGDAIARGDLTIGPGQRVETAVAYGGDLIVNGRVDGDAMAMGGDVILGPGALVKGSVITLGGEITKGPGARVRGDEVALGGSSFSKVISSTIAKNRHHVDDSDDEDEASDHGLSISGFLVWFAVLFGVGFLFMIFAPDRMKGIEAQLKADPVKCALTGFVGALAFGPFLVLLCITIVGIPVAFAAALLAPLALAIGYGAIANELGMRMPFFHGRKTQALVLAMGLAVILAVGLIPVLGALVHIACILLGFGAILRTRFGSRPKGFPEPLPHHTVPV
ncbi:MAG: hypothetical protein ACT4TC_03275 [Myxococcaceae bacterium]